jgi:hypothetical protein
MKLRLSVLTLLLTFSLQSHSAEEKQPSEAQIIAISSAITNKLNNTDPEAIKKRIQASLVSQREYLKVRLEAMSDPEVAQSLAKFSRVYYESLVEEGFSKKEAMQLVISVGLPKLN